MILGTWGAAYFTYYYGPWIGHPRRRRCSGCSAALLHALATVTFGVDHIVSGVAINIIALGADDVPGRGVLRRPRAAAAPSSSPGSTRRPTITIPGLSDGVDRPRTTSTGSWSPTSRRSSRR